jgi:hypothetical protein
MNPWHLASAGARYVVAITFVTASALPTGALGGGPIRPDPFDHEVRDVPSPEVSQDPNRESKLKQAKSEWNVHKVPPYPSLLRGEPFGISPYPNTWVIPRFDRKPTDNSEMMNSIIKDAVDPAKDKLER